MVIVGYSVVLRFLVHVPDAVDALVQRSSIITTMPQDSRSLSYLIQLITMELLILILIQTQQLRNKVHFSFHFPSLRQQKKMQEDRGEDKAFTERQKKYERRGELLGLWHRVKEIRSVIFGSCSLQLRSR